MDAFFFNFFIDIPLLGIADAMETDIARLVISSLAMYIHYYNYITNC